MPSIPLGKGSYKRLDNPTLRLVNMTFEASPTNLEDQVSLIQRSGLTFLANMGFTTNPVNRIHFQAGTSTDDFYVIIASFLRRVSLDGTVTNIGVVANTNYAQMASLNGKSVIVGDGTLAYQLIGESTLSILTTPSGFVAATVDVIADRFILTGVDTDQFFWSDLDSTTINALNFATAETRPDFLVCVATTNSEVWFLGEDSTEVWAPTGNADLPFQRINGRVFDIGCISANSVAKQDGAIFWVSTGDPYVYMTAPNPTRISDACVEERLRSTDPAVIRGYCVTQAGHSYFVLNLGSQGTWAYDLNSQAWVQWKTHGMDTFIGRAASVVANNKTVVGDGMGNVYLSDPAVNTDSDRPIVREFSGLLDVSVKLRCSNVLLDCTVGNAPGMNDNPKIEMRYSDDRGKLWTEWDAVSLGHQGEFSNPVVWNRLGLIQRPGRIFQWRCAEDLNLTVRRAKFNERY